MPRSRLHGVDSAVAGLQDAYNTGVQYWAETAFWSPTWKFSVPKANAAAALQAAVQTAQAAASKNPADEEVALLAGELAACPLGKCLAYVADKIASLHRREGGGMVVATFFQASAPPYPGLRFEIPKAPTDPSGQSGPVFLAARQQLRRMAPTIYYMVEVDTALSVEKQALKAYQVFLRALVVDAAQGR